MPTNKTVVLIPQTLPGWPSSDRNSSKQTGKHGRPMIRSIIFLFLTSTGGQEGINSFVCPAVTNSGNFFNY